MNIKDTLFGSLAILGLGLVILGISRANKPSIESKVVELHMASNKPVIEADSFSARIRKIPFVSRGTCSGEFIDEFGDVLTAKHCVADFDSIEVVTFDQFKYEASVVSMSDTQDLALIHINRINTPYFKLADDVTRGESIFALGSPLSITNVLTTGIVAKLNGDTTLLDCGILPGNSGGPAFDQSGKLVGVVVGGHIVGLGTTHLNIAQSIESVRFFLATVLPAGIL